MDDNMMEFWSLHLDSQEKEKQAELLEMLNYTTIPNDEKVRVLINAYTPHTENKYTDLLDIALMQETEEFGKAVLKLINDIW